MSSRAFRFGLVLTTFMATACAEGTEDNEAMESQGAAMTAMPSVDGSLASQVPTLQEATARFADVNVALAEGYIPDPSGMCVTAEIEGAPRQLGAMGIHYFRPDLLGLAPPAPQARVSGEGPSAADSGSSITTAFPASRATGPGWIALELTWRGVSET